MAYDLTDKIYNDWTVLYECERPKGVKTKDKYWMCQCTCGTIKPVSNTQVNKSPLPSMFGPQMFQHGFGRA